MASPCDALWHRRDTLPAAMLARGTTAAFG